MSIFAAINDASVCVRCGLPFRQCACPPPDDHDGPPRVLYQGTLSLAGHELRCYVLDNGQRIFDGEDFVAAFGDLIEPLGLLPR